MDSSSSYKEDASGNSLILKELKINMYEASIITLPFLNLKPVNNIDTTLDTSTLTLTFGDFLLPVVTSIILYYYIEIEGNEKLNTCNTYLKDDNNNIIGSQNTILNTTVVNWYPIEISNTIDVSTNISYSPVIEINSDSPISEFSNAYVRVYNAKLPRSLPLRNEDIVSVTTS
jgi:hypothetical protein